MMLNESSRHRRTHTVWFHSQEALEESDPERQEVDGGARGWGGWSVNGDRVFIWENEAVLEMMVGVVARQCEGIQCH